MNRIPTHHDSLNSRAVSPVIGVILMVAVTVILASVVSTLVLGMGSDVESTPQASFGFDSDGAGTVTITHTGGESLANASVAVIGATGGFAWDTAVTDDSKLTAGETGTATVDPGDELTIVWTGNDDRSAILSSYMVPS